MNLGDIRYKHEDIPDNLEILDLNYRWTIPGIVGPLNNEQALRNKLPPGTLKQFTLKAVLQTHSDIGYNIRSKGGDPKKAMDITTSPVYFEWVLKEISGFNADLQTKLPVHMKNGLNSWNKRFTDGIKAALQTSFYPIDAAKLDGSIVCFGAEPLQSFREAYTSYEKLHKYLFVQKVEEILSIKKDVHSTSITKVFEWPCEVFSTPDDQIRRYLFEVDSADPNAHEKIITADILDVWTYLTSGSVVIILGPKHCVRQPLADICSTTDGGVVPAVVICPTVSMDPNTWTNNGGNAVKDPNSPIVTCIFGDRTIWSETLLFPQDSLWGEISMYTRLY
ncbi:hypothetical protein CC80DRAFT_574357 [Byssothecium circinans]|uniref:Uncharacterized protein n=1 Tax=Byssothecium circinans TaxID=147558 RepID=A0A6A5UL12_9PLEO|nr:hypothetical protein CC80DRAFT_574357 [Byssothecium circinans]